jgi:hypothetical protein
MDAPTLVSRLLELDATFSKSVEAMFGGLPQVDDLVQFAFATGGVTKHGEIVTKMMPSAPDVSTSATARPKKPRALVAPKPKIARRVTAVGPSKPQAPAAPAPVKPVTSDTSLTKRGSLPRGTLKRVARAATSREGAAGLVVGGGAGYSAGRTKRKPTRQTIYTARTAEQVLYGKSGDIEWAGEFTKFDDDKRLAFGWASVVSLNGEPVLDKQGDVIAPDEIEKAAYQYMLASRKGGEMHKRQTSAAGVDEPVHVADIVESFVVTPEKVEKMGLPSSMPLGWWVGYKVHDDAAWAKVKKGDYKGFSIHGRGRRTPVEI